MFPLASPIDGKDWWRFAAVVVAFAQLARLPGVRSRQHHFEELETVSVGIGKPALEVAAGTELRTHQSQHL